MADPRIVYGARCFWWDSIGQVGTKPGRNGLPGLPCCPHCGSVLFEAETEAAWWAGIERAEREMRPGYKALCEWSRGQCFPSYEAAQLAFDTAKRAWGADEET
jgi:hypothetical protein